MTTTPDPNPNKTRFYAIDAAADPTDVDCDDCGYCANCEIEVDDEDDDDDD